MVAKSRNREHFSPGRLLLPGRSRRKKISMKTAHQRQLNAERGVTFILPAKAR
jgi:hypothetical protein